MTNVDIENLPDLRVFRPDLKVHVNQSSVDADEVTRVALGKSVITKLCSQPSRDASHGFSWVR